MVAFHAFAFAGFGPFIEFDAKIFCGGLVGHFIIVSENIIGGMASPRLQGLKPAISASEICRS
jgi:hypothetical protein